MPVAAKALVSALQRTAGIAVTCAVTQAGLQAGRTTNLSEIARAARLSASKTAEWDIQLPLNDGTGCLTMSRS